jgi:hypothetical protein
MRRATAIAFVVAVLVTLTASPARACSCASIDLREGLRERDGAFVGELIGRGGWPWSSTSTFTFRVERSLKGDFGDVVDVESSSNGASCGLEVEEGQRIGLLLDRDDGTWWSSLCWQVDPDLLIEAAEPLPAPDGQGPVRFLIGGDSAGYRTLALDGTGRTLAYGPGEGKVYRASVCPGARLAVEVVAGEDAREGHLVAVRDLRTMAVAIQMRLPDSEVDVWDVSCRDRMARQVLVLVSDWPEGSNRGRLLRVTPGGVETVADLRMRSGAMAGRAIYVMTPEWELLKVDPDSGKTEKLARFPRNTWSFEVSPVRAMVAGVVSRHDAEPGDPPSRIFVRELGGEGSIVFTPLEDAGVTGTFVWVDDATVAFFARGGWSELDEVLLFDASLELVGRIDDWRAREGVVVDGFVYGLRYGYPARELVAARLPDGPTKVLRSFDTPDLYELVHVPGSTIAGTIAAPGAARLPVDRSPGETPAPARGAWPLVLLAGSVLGTLLWIRRHKVSAAGTA